MTRRVIHTVTFASCYVYSPNGPGALCERSRALRTLIKSGNSSFMLKYAIRVRQQAEDSPYLAGFFDTNDVLVPVPGSTPGGPCVAEHLTAALLDAGLGGAAWPGLRRLRAVAKSATAEPGSRPTVTVHYESFALDRPSMPPERIVLIDDVVTRGRTLLAAASRVREALPSCQVRAFALLRTMGLSSGVRRLLDPCRGEIRLKSGEAYRSP